MTGSEQEEKFVSFIRSRGLKYTTERSAILGAIQTFRGHFNADDLHARLKSGGETISRATVYRSLPLFLESGFIKETVRAHETTSYEAVAGREHHDHLICLRCQRMIEFKDERIERLQEDVCKQYKFSPVDHWMSIRGFCRDCRGKQ